MTDSTRYCAFSLHITLPRDKESKYLRILAVDCDCPTDGGVGHGERVIYGCLWRTVRSMLVALFGASESKERQLDR